MTKEQDEYLCTTYPEIFKKRHVGVRNACMARGFECGPGWFNIIDALCSRIADTGAPVVAEQVKEKFGTLRFYFSGCPAEFTLPISSYIAMATSMSARTCEECGAPGTLRGGSWLKTLCDIHGKKRENND